MRTPLQRLIDSMTKDNLWIYILALLSERDMYPYEVGKEIEQRFQFKPGNVTAYLVIKKLERDNYVAQSDKIVKRGPERKYYRITEMGRSELEQGKIEIRKWSTKF